MGQRLRYRMNLNNLLNYNLYLTDYEYSQVIHSLIELKNNLIQAGKYTDVVDGKKIQKVVGFLCADSLSKKAFRESQKGINVRLMQCFADIYSLVMKEYDEKLDIKRS